MQKKGEAYSKFWLVLIVVILLGVTFLIQEASSQVCNPTVQVACSEFIDTAGHGAVELCQTCFVCGLEDGICPESYSDGTVETDDNKTRVLLRAGSDRPDSGASPGDDDYPILYNNGNLGCDAINGSCTGLESKLTWLGAWVPSGAGCSTDMGSINDYVRAVCNAPKTAGCQYCPDPDCVTNIIGITMDAITNESVPAHVNVVSLDNTNFRAEGTSSGTYNMQSPRGNVRVICTAEDYDITEIDVFLQRGLNIVDCRLGEAACSPACTLPDINGNPICAAKCDLQNACVYASEGSKAICDNLPLGATVIINRTNETTITAVTCCSGNFVQVYRPRIGGLNSHIPNLLTRDYRKELNGIPVNLRIITYSKE